MVVVVEGRMLNDLEGVPWKRETGASFYCSYLGLVTCLSLFAIVTFKVNSWEVGWGIPFIKMGVLIIS